MSSRTLVPTCFSIGSHQYGEPNEIVYGPDRRVVRPHCKRWAEDVSCPRLDLTVANTTCLPLNSSTRDGRTVRHPDEAKHPFVSSTPGLWRWRNLHGLRALSRGGILARPGFASVTGSAGEGSSGSSTRARSERWMPSDRLASARRVSPTRWKRSARMLNGGRIIQVTEHRVELRNPSQRGEQVADAADGFFLRACLVRAMDIRHRQRPACRLSFGPLVSPARPAAGFSPRHASVWDFLSQGSTMSQWRGDGTLAGQHASRWVATRAKSQREAPSRHCGSQPRLGALAPWIA